MVEMDWVECEVMIGGDIRMIGYRGPTEPLSIPEIAVIRELHGEESVRKMKYVKTTETTPAEEKNRLLSKYSAGVVNTAFPGRAPQMHMKADDRPSKEIEGGMRKVQRAGTKLTAAEPFIPSLSESEQ
jgi:hypothetical protein